jgi:two-component system cell cycle sensor histidine kinase/response regulator CckA
LGNVLVNLAVNSRDAMPAGGTLTIRTSNASITDAPSPGSAIVPPGEYVLIEVADTGCGIAPENMSKIFEPFFTTKEKGQGTGLGLSSVYGIIQQSRGFIVPESETGKGTTFRIYLPRHVPGEKPDAPAVAPAAGEAAAPARDLTGHQTVLLVEDEEGVRDFAARALTMRGYKVLQASSGDEALELLRQHEGVLDLLVTDVLMPGMDGPTLAKTVRGLNPTLKVLFISGYPDDKLQNTGDRPEDFHFLAKPFSLKQLTSKVKDVLES